jgi:hypothetical protein
MIKMREAWPLNHKSEVIDFVKEVRSSVVSEDGLYDCAALGEVRRRAEMLITPVEPSVIEGREINALMTYWEEWVKWAK